MAITYSNTTLCSHELAIGRIGPSALAINGRQVNDVVAFMRAPAVTVFPRGGRAYEISFRVYGFFSSLAAAQQYAALHFGQLPTQGDLIETDDDDNPLWSLPDACISSLRTGRDGLGVYLEYAFTGGAFESEDINLPDGDSDLVKAKVVNLVAGEVSKAITYDAPFATPPRFVQGQISAPDGGVAFFAIPRESTRNAEGITFDLTQAVPDDGRTYKLLVHAVL